jgi:hypothetical protein
MKMRKSYYLQKKSRFKNGIILIVFSILPYIFLTLVIDEINFIESFIVMGWFNIFWLIFFQSGVSFLLINKLPILILGNDELFYNESFMPKGRGDGIFFILFPYTYINLTEKITYSSIESFSIKNNKWLFGRQLIFELKTKPSFLRYMPIFNLNTLTNEEIDEINTFLKNKIL